MGGTLVGLEIASSDLTYPWRKIETPTQWQRYTLFREAAVGSIPRAELRQALRTTLDVISPVAVAICGYHSPDALAILRWCKRRRRRAILLSETGQHDGPRIWWKEAFKRFLVSKFDAAICGGTVHRAYLQRLGFPLSKISLGYDVVDNRYFERAAQMERQQSRRALPYFLASGRFVERKNYHTLIRAYARYVQSKRAAGGAAGSSGRVWDLVLLGDGPERMRLQEICRTLEIEVATDPFQNTDDCSAGHTAGRVFFPGFKQIEDLPRFYAWAGAFIHPATTEPWGLVLNEAMASGLPLLASAQTGAATDLIQDGVNGWRFQSHDDDELARRMLMLSDLSHDQLKAMGASSLRIVQKNCPLSAFGNAIAARTADLLNAPTDLTDAS
jgi:glycosyltransferase involved in cell wall biosynthesis